MKHILTVIVLWLLRLFFLTLLVLIWLGFAAGMKHRRDRDDLRTRGQRTVVKEVPLTRLEEIMIDTPPSRHFRPSRKYYFVVEGKRYHGSSYGKERIDGRTVTYLPEDPDRHQLGYAEPEPVSFVEILIPVISGLVSLPFFFFCLWSPGRDGRPTLVGVQIVLGLAVAQTFVVFATLSLAKPPFEAVLELYVPAFVAGAFAAVLGVRIFAWKRGLTLAHPPENPSGEAVSPSPAVLGMRAGVWMSGWWWS